MDDESSNLHVIAFDESGNTGQDLLNEAQPVFVLASVHISEREAEELIGKFNLGRGQEVKFKRLKKSSHGRDAVLSLLTSTTIRPETSKLFLYHKPFMVTTKMVDMLVETLAYRDGINLYERGANIAMSNAWHLTFPAFFGEKLFRTLQERFVRMVRHPSRTAIFEFYRCVEFLYISARGSPWEREVALLVASQEVLGTALGPRDSAALEPAISAFILLCDLWGRQLQSRFDVIHDRSKPMAHEQETLSLLMAENEPEVVVGYDRRTQVLPLKAKSISFVDSHLNARIQVADVLASAAAHWASGLALGRLDEFQLAIAASGLPNLLVGAVWPSDAVTPQELETEEVGGIDAVDYMTQMIARQRAERSASASSNPTPKDTAN